jgi:hypothetical protein
MIIQRVNGFHPEAYRFLVKMERFKWPPAKAGFGGHLKKMRVFMLSRSLK